MKRTVRIKPAEPPAEKATIHALHFAFGEVAWQTHQRPAPRKPKLRLVKGRKDQDA